MISLWTKDFGITEWKIRRLGILFRTFVSRDLGQWKDLYFSMVRQHSVYAVHSCNPNFEGDIDRIEIAQKREIIGFKNFNYNEFN